MTMRVGRARVLMYHAFAAQAAADDPLNLTVTADSLDRQLATLHRGGWATLDLQTYVQRRGWTGQHRAVLVTIDDGYATVAEIAAPIFAKWKVRPVMFVPPALIGHAGVHDAVPAGELMDAAALRALADDGFDIGVHGWDHQRMIGMSAADLRRQTVDARSAVADLTGQVPQAFAYPVGEFDAAARDAVAAAGFDVGFAVHRDDGRFAISRVDVNAIDTDRSFRLKLMPGYRRVWRAADRAAFVRRGARRLLGSRN